MGLRHALLALLLCAAALDCSFARRSTHRHKNIHRSRTAKRTQMDDVYASTNGTAKATFYGGSDGAGTMNGACGYGNLYAAGYGLLNAAASIALWNSGSICGACYEVTCSGSKWCLPGGKVNVTITNLCPNGSEGGWCDAPRHHLDMAEYAWLKIASDPKAGIVSTNMRRVPCQRQGGMKFQMTGNPWWLAIQIFNVAGSGDVAAFEVSTDGGKTFSPFKREWGSRWSIGQKLTGSALTFRVTSLLVNQQVVIPNAVPSNWQVGNTYSTNVNFQY